MVCVNEPALVGSDSPIRQLNRVVLPAPFAHQATISPRDFQRKVIDGNDAANGMLRFQRQH